MLGMVQFTFKNVRNMVIYDTLKNFGKIDENSYRSIISNRGSFSFFENRDNSCLIPQVRKKYSDIG
jgi:hypothetical protein